MMILSKTFLTDDPHDLEYKQYCVLAYQQRCNTEFEFQRIYPVLFDINEHYKNISTFINNKSILEKSHSYITGIDFNNLTLKYKSKIIDEKIQVFEEIANWSIEIFKSLLNNGKFIYELIERQINVELVKNENSDFGYLLFLNKPSKLYQYSLKNIYTNNDSFWGINVNFIKEIKNNILTNIAENQPIWHISYPEYLSLEHSVLPVTKRLIMKKHIENIK